MDIIHESAEHHFLTKLEALKKDPADWIVLHFALSKQCPHDAIVENRHEIQNKITQSRERAEAFLNQFYDLASSIEEGFLYLFSDHDVVFLGYAKNEADKKIAQAAYKSMAVQFSSDMCESGLLSNELNRYFKLADKKILSARRFEAYNLMCDENKVESITVRRGRREDTIVLMVEDDRFTAAYTSSILNKDFDLVVCKNGEEAISAYIEHAPDIVLMDIHLPGLSGHETLQAIHSIDKEAFVVMVSVDTARKSIENAANFGAKNFLKKPFSKERLMNTVKKSPFIKGQYSVSSDDTLH